jgi:hypothetical protein
VRRGSENLRGATPLAHGAVAIAQNDSVTVIASLYTPM